MNALPNDGDDVEDRVAGGEPGGDRRRRDDEQRIQSQGEADDDDEDADEWKHASDAQVVIGRPRAPPLATSVYICSTVYPLALSSSTTPCCHEVRGADDDQRVVALEQLFDLRDPALVPIGHQIEKRAGDSARPRLSRLSSTRVASDHASLIFVRTRADESGPFDIVSIVS